MTGDPDGEAAAATTSAAAPGTTTPTLPATATAWADDVAVPALLRAARSAYGSAIRHDLAHGGFDDVPRNGSYVLGAIARTDAPMGEIIGALGVSKQAAGQLVDTLVVRGYLSRTADEQDRRRLRISLTDRGAAAAATIRAAVEAVDAQVLAMVGAEHVAHTRRTLAALTTLAAHHREPHGEQ